MLQYVYSAYALLIMQAMSAKLVSNSLKRGLVAGLLGLVTGLTTFWSVSQAQMQDSAVAPVGKTVLLTSFGLWGKKQVNSSMPAAEKTKALLESAGYSVTICNVPVLWDRSADLVTDCYRQMPVKPDLVVSFGVGQTEHIASGAKNLDKGSKDAGNEKRKKKTIDPTLPETLMFQLPNGWTFDQAVRSSGSVLPIKPNAGSFICNNLAFHLGHYFAGEHIPFFFIHVNDHTNAKLVKKLGFASAEAMSENSALQSARVIDIILK